MELFAINCTTCRARLKVREQSAIGQIVHCPKCGCMLQITAPPGWQPPQPQAAPIQPSAPIQSIGPIQPIAPAEAVAPAQAMASVLAAAAAVTHWSSPAVDTVPAGAAPVADFAPKATEHYVDPQAVRVDLAAAVPAALPPKARAWVPVAKDCVAAWLPWASVPLAGMLSAWVVGFCLRTDVPTAPPLGPSPAATEIAAAVLPLATPTMPSRDPPVAPDAAVPVPPTTFANPPSDQPPSDQPKIAAATMAGNDSPLRTAMRPVTPSLDIEAASRNPSPVANGSRSNAPASNVQQANTQPPSALARLSLPVVKPRQSPPKLVAKAKPPLPSSVDRPQVDVKQALATRIASLEMPSIPLLGFVQLVGGLTGVPLTLDADACRELAIKLDTPLAVHEHDVALAELLRHVLEPHALMAEVVKGQLIVTASAAHRYQLQSVRYSVSDLNDTPSALAGWIEQLVEPKRWIGQGGAGRVDNDGPQLVVLQPPRVQHEVLLLLDKLRQARGKPALGRLDPFEVSLDSPSRQLAAQLETPVSVNYRQPAELETVVRELVRGANVRLLIDWQSLAAAGCQPQSLVSLVADKQPLAAALDELLGPLELSYRVVAAETLEVASTSALRARTELEVYRIRDLLDATGASQAPVEAIGRWLATELPDMAWGDGAAWRFDRQSSCLLVRHDAMSQRAIEAALHASLAAARAENDGPARENASAALPASRQP